jgi:hypothetical protein
MRDKWVDLNDYFGPDRRRRTGKKPWRDRRHHDEATKPPALGALLRRLRVQLMDVNGPDHRRRALQLLDAALAEAQRQQAFEVLNLLRRAQTALRNGSPADLPEVETAISEALTMAAHNA